jgi:DHA2 family multidrug resistance protein
MNYNSTWAGLVTAPMGLFGILVAPFIGQWIRKADARLFASVAFAAFALVVWWRSTMTTDVDASIIALTCLAQGIGLGLFFTPLVSLSLIGIPLEKVASAAGLQTAIRMMAGSLMASLAQTFWDQRARFHQNHLVDALANSDHTSAATRSLYGAGFGEGQAWGLIDHQTDVQAHMLALNDFFYFSTFAFAATIGIIWLARKAPKSA